MCVINIKIYTRLVKLPCTQYVTLLYICFRLPHSSLSRAAIYILFFNIEVAGFLIYNSNQGVKYWVALLLLDKTHNILTIAMSTSIRILLSFVHICEITKTYILHYNSSNSFALYNIAVMVYL